MAGKKKAVIVTGDPIFAEDKPDAERFYSEIEDYLRSKGYEVSRDPGDPYASPKKADLWVGHSRGAGRLRFAPEGVATVALGSDLPGAVNHPRDDLKVGKLSVEKDTGFSRNKYHYVFTPEMKKAIDEADSGKRVVTEAGKGSASTEREYTFYALMKDRSELQKATRKKHLEQWLIRSKSETKGGTIRVRCTDRRDYEATVKNYRPHSGGTVVRNEATVPCDRDFFEAFKRLATRGEDMTRYYFPAGGGLEWEVDVYEGSDWCCLDLEVPAGAELPPFPIRVSREMDASLPENDDKIAALFDREFIIVNKDSITPLMESSVNWAPPPGGDLVEKCREYARESMGEEGSHDFRHVERVESLAIAVWNAGPSGTKFRPAARGRDVVRAAALLHDVADHKLAGPEKARELELFIRKLGDAEFSEAVMACVTESSWSKGKKPSSFESACLQDADRLEAIGAIGVARCFAYGGSKNRPLESSIDHFHEKLLRLAAGMNTRGGKELGRERHDFMVGFLGRLDEEGIDSGL